MSNKEFFRRNFFNFTQENSEFLSSKIPPHPPRKSKQAIDSVFVNYHADNMSKRLKKSADFSIESLREEVSKKSLQNYYLILNLSI